MFFLTGIATSIPFIGSLIYGGYWIERSGLSTDRYARIARWWVAGIIGVIILVGVNMFMDSISVLRLIGIIRWSSAIGGSIGLMLGILQARAINHSD
jgi:two-component system OmpR family sensor kinase